MENVLIMLNIINNRTDRSILVKVRVSAHDLAIEKGRYSRQLRQSRICLTCDLGLVEDEEHFLLSCVARETLRIFY